MVECLILGDVVSNFIFSVYMVVLMYYMSSELKVEMFWFYFILNGFLYLKWNWCLVFKDKGWELYCVNVFW